VNLVLRMRFEARPARLVLGDGGCRCREAARVGEIALDEHGRCHQNTGPDQERESHGVGEGAVGGGGERVGRPGGEMCSHAGRAPDRIGRRVRGAGGKGGGGGVDLGRRSGASMSAQTNELSPAIESSSRGYRAPRVGVTALGHEADAEQERPSARPGR
jgi:hypothetical protein